MRTSQRTSQVGQLDAAVLGEVAVDLTLQVDALPGAGEFALARSRSRFAGGSAANVAVALSRLGQRVGFFGAVGDDEDGRFLRRAFELEDVDTTNLIEISGYKTPSCLVVVDRLGDRVILGFPRDPVATPVSRFDLEELRGARVIFIGPTHTGMAARLFAASQARDATLAYAPGGLCHCLAPGELQPVLDEADILFVSGPEATALTGVSNPEDAMAQLAGTGPALIVGTLGERGALVVRGEERHRVPAVTVNQVVDTTGAGDAFAAGFIAAYLRGLKPRRAMSVGCAVAASAIQQLGARVGLPSWEEAWSVAESG